MSVRKAYTPEELRELAAEPLDVFHPHLLAAMRGALRFSADMIEAANEALRPPAAMVKVGRVSSLMGNFCVIKLDGFTVRKGDVLYAAKDTP